MTTMTVGSELYTSPIKLGEEYIDPRTGIRGWAVAIFFHQTGCVEVYLESMKEGADKPVRQFFSEQRLCDPETNEPPTTMNEYRSDIVLGREYEDEQTKLKGHAAMMEFWEHQSNRVSLKQLQGEAGKKQEIKYHSIDDHHAVDVQTKVQAREAQPGRRSPSAQTVERDKRY